MGPMWHNYIMQSAKSDFMSETVYTINVLILPAIVF